MKTAGLLDDPRVTESSGLAPSRAHPGQLWTHNDSGGRARLFRFDPQKPQTGAAAVVTLDLPRPKDWEDMAAFVWKDLPWLLVADVGDNQAKRDFVTLWLLREEDWVGPTHQTTAFRIDLRYADGPRDCEAVAVDSARGEVILVSKIDSRRDFREQAAAYVFHLEEALRRILETSSGQPDPLVLEPVARLPLKITTAADVSPDGRRLVVATYGDAWEYARGEDETWPQALAKPPRQIALGPRGQSESICYGLDGQTLWLTAEGVGKPVWSVSRRETQ